VERIRGDKKGFDRSMKTRKGRGQDGACGDRFFFLPLRCTHKPQTRQRYRINRAKPPSQTPLYQTCPRAGSFYIRYLCAPNFRISSAAGEGQDFRLRRVGTRVFFAACSSSGSPQDEPTEAEEMGSSLDNGAPWAARGLVAQEDTVQRQVHHITQHTNSL